MKFGLDKRLSQKREAPWLVRTLLTSACDGDYGCADHSQCVNPSGDTMSGCCIPKTME